MGTDIGDRFDYLLQPLRRVHLYSLSDYGIDSGGDIRYLYRVGPSR